MCRLLGYLGEIVSLEKLLYKPEHSLIVQSYQPREMNSGLLNADGCGVGWYHTQRDTNPFTYKSVLPIWNDVNLPSLSRYVESGCALAYVRSATLGQAVDLSNCQPFDNQKLLCIHNGRIENFRQTIYRPIRDRLSDFAYQAIKGSTDSEHIFALLLDEVQANPSMSLEQALSATINNLDLLAKSHQTRASANLLISDGKRLIAARFASDRNSPSLYWLRDDPAFPAAVIIASEPLFKGDWHSMPEHSIVSVGEDLEIQFHQI
ncbi:ergothioneine biosynthesis protein EgtC [Chroococcidiopsis sp. CCALA 051]|uniref:ergothioneine biosynthesis protein EgtC n=1 Tax=Chroococcidiopsis sp. CCALA 051 TaxID=869949 RepID=UPI000D0D609D|nr:ergothioneine biosynthesis protein EgtC [Chroococcidiopsis sp. CCALA 051]MBE9015741.1 ergothioneine biosynthesis protein EgtC [Chroococcidiopsidales cyanobacterium LEGE 13417]PSM48132.1 ergothioneine biosynthesis protein EgtC [Chroococcidiopsis sp. CCALA 051]